MKNFTFILIVFISVFTVNAQIINATSKIKSYNIQQKFVPPVLNIVQGSIKFSDHNNNNRLDANDTANISFFIENIGEGPGYGLTINIESKTKIKGIIIPKSFNLPTVTPGDKIEVSIPIIGTEKLTTGIVNLNIEIKEPHDLSPDPFPLEFKTLEYQNPELKLVDGHFVSKNVNGVFKYRESATLELIVQNMGQGIAENVVINFVNPENILNISDKSQNLGSLNSNESRNVSFEFITNAKFNKKELEIFVNVTESKNKYGHENLYNVKIDEKLEVSKIIVQSEEVKETQIEKKYLKSDVDMNIQFKNKIYPHRYALVIGNEDYTSKQSGLRNEVNVEFARNDANSFKNYLFRLGFKEDHVTVLKDATAGTMNREIAKLIQLAKLDNSSEIVFYYAGHGLPDDDKNPYLLPVDVKTINLTDDGLALKELYSKLASSNAVKITVFLDACFSGGGRDQGLLSARGVKIKPKQEVFTGNMVVFASSSGEERSLPYKEKQHGFFTYFLLKKIQETKGDVNYGELSKYIKEEVSRSSLLKKSLQQTPNTKISESVTEDWEKWTFK